MKDVCSRDCMGLSWSWKQWEAEMSRRYSPELWNLVSMPLHVAPVESTDTVSSSNYAADFFRVFPSEAFSLVASYWCKRVGAGWSNSLCGRRIVMVMVFLWLFFFRLHSTAVGTSLLGAALLQAGVRNSQDWRQKLRAKDFAVWGAASVTKQIVLSHMHCDAKHLHASFNDKQLWKKNIMLQMMEWHCEGHMVVLAK